MASRGPLPKPDEKRARTNEPAIAWTDVPKGSRAVGAPRLSAAERRRLHPEARRFWDVWLKAPQAVLFVETDWLALRMMLPLVDAYHRDPTAAKLSEIRQGVGKLGATLDDRFRMRVRVDIRGHVESAEEKAAAGGAAAKSSSGKRRKRTDPRLRVVDGGG